MLKPPAVAPDARVAVIAPASSSKPERLARGIEALRARGYDAEFGKYAQGRQSPYFSGTAMQRLADLHAAFADPQVQAIFCTRGGYGSNYLLEDIDLDLIRDNPKPLFGYSDMTALQTWFLDQLGLVSFHGPMVAADFAVDDGVHDVSFDAALDGEAVAVGTPEGLRILRPGHAQGVMYGGCLSILTASLGTRFAPQTEGKLLFLEDVGAKPYQMDRMLRQMMLGGKFDGVSGFIFGEMLECVSPGTGPELLEQVILRVLDWFDGPIAIGLQSGHVSRSNVTLPFGIEAELILEYEPVLRYLEPAVQVD
ncbi:LD-carboxypeptidase [Alloacidobacterium sp.]|uniref:S66 peptidase family protein n=1 Tax=Alloacidobacterium sp. TaxID=2951999 RepID=UPI002D56D0AC|nr:LD-carboxypeptidase [Alloacidobacterium sp.]HYK37631.1 LD-carboxypeptidase [Alloacidobacterium sp.]